MKLRNKKTGEIIDVYKGQVLLHYNNGRKTIHFKSLEELEEWEDYEEPKEYFYIYADGDIYKDIQDDVRKDNGCKEIGNYFETKEDAEKAVEKLKVFKRLKDKGFRFSGWIREHKKGSADITIASFIDEDFGITDDLNLLFGGEE